MTEQQARTVCAEVQEGWDKQEGADNTGTWVAQNATCPHCKRSDWYVLPEDSAGCAACCYHCFNCLFN